MSRLKGMENNSTSVTSMFIYYIPPTMILLIGMCISLTKNPTNPMIKNPNPVALAILANSADLNTVIKMQEV